MGLFSGNDKMKELKSKTPISPEFIAMISNTVGEDFEEEIFEGNYMVTSKSKIMAITNSEIIPISPDNLAEIRTEDMRRMESEKYGELVGIGQTWVQKEILKKILEALELYEKEYKLFINPVSATPLLIKTYEGNITLAPVVLG